MIGDVNKLTIFLYMQNEKPTSRVLYFDILNVLACISVVILHSNKYIHTFQKDEWWWLRVLIEVLFYSAVPIFFMLSGATLFPYRQRYSTRTFYRKRFLRTFVPFVFWSVLFYCIYVLNTGLDAISFKDIVQHVIEGKIPYTNYCFFIPLFLLYLFIPFLSIMVLRLSTKGAFSLCLILIVFQFVIPTVCALCGLVYDKSLPIGGYVIYALLGYYMSIYQIEKERKFMIVLFVLSIFSMGIRYSLIMGSEVKETILFSYFGLYALFPAMFFSYWQRDVVTVMGIPNYSFPIW